MTSPRLAERRNTEKQFPDTIEVTYSGSDGTSLRWFFRHTKLKASLEIPLVCHVLPGDWEAQVPGETRSCADLQPISKAIVIGPSRAMAILGLYRLSNSFSAPFCNSF
jgi:hypothetical protein